MDKQIKNKYNAYLQTLIDRIKQYSDCYADEIVEECIEYLTKVGRIVSVVFKVYDTETETYYMTPKNKSAWKQIGHAKNAWNHHIIPGKPWHESKSYVYGNRTYKTYVKFNEQNRWVIHKITTYENGKADVEEIK